MKDKTTVTISAGMTSEQIWDIEQMIAEAELYIDGDRAQMELPLEQEAVA